MNGINPDSIIIEKVWFKNGIGHIQYHHEYYSTKEADG